MHCAPRNKEGLPFAIGQINPDKGFVHVFDDTTLNVVLRTLDTIIDFVEYLEKKELLITNGQLIWAAGEDDLLAYYLKSYDSDDKHGFIIPADIDGISIDEGFWDHFSNSPQRFAQLAANKISYAWDDLIESFAKHMLAGTSYHTSHSNLAYQERYFRFLARESRFRRRLLAQAFLDLIWKTPKDIRATRTVIPMNPGEPYYVFLLMPHPANVPYEQYRSVREKLLANYCTITKLKFPDAQDIIGIATESGRREEGSEDVTYLDVRLWSDKDQADAERVQAEMGELGLFGEYRLFKSSHKEYPDVPAPTQAKGSRIPLAMKGRNRNSPCPCGSGKKIKKCCGH